MTKLKENVTALSKGAGELAAGAGQVQGGADAMKNQLTQLKGVVAQTQTFVTQAKDLLDAISYPDAGVMSQEATSQAQKAAAEKLQQQKNSVSAALDTAGVTEDQKAAILASMSVDAGDIQIHISDDTAEKNAHVKAQLEGISGGLDKISEALSQVRWMRKFWQNWQTDIRNSGRSKTITSMAK